MTKIDIEAIAREAGLDDSASITPYFLQRLGVYSALLLEKAAQVCDVTPPEPFRPSIEAAHAIRQMAAGMGE